MVAELRRKLGPAIRTRVGMPNACLTCKHPLDAATGTRPDCAVTPGGVSVCLYCGAVAMFTQDLRLRALTEAEAASVEDDPMLASMRALVAARHVKRGTN